VTTVDPKQMQELLALARVRAGEGRASLFESMSDLFVSDSARLSARERAMMHDILRKLIGDVEMSIRRELADRLSAADDAEDVPEELVTLLANDEIAVARPILLNSQLLADRALVEIVRRRSQEHRLVIATRESLSSEVSDALIAEAEVDVIVTLIENDDAEISRLAMEYLVEQSRRVDRFQEPLLQRQDMPPELAYRMFWWVSAALRRYVLESFTVDVTDIDRHLETAAAAALENLGSGDSKAVLLVARLDERGELTERLLVQCLREAQVPVFIAGLARRLVVGLDTARFITYDPGGEGLALACRMLEFSRANFATVYLLSRGAQEGEQANVITDPRRLNNILRFFDDTTAEQATIALNYWRKDSAYLVAVDELDESTAALTAPSAKS
jgi:uncharacterized protein (DUF2336 family)